MQGTRRVLLLVVLGVVLLSLGACAALQRSTGQEPLPMPAATVAPAAVPVMDAGSFLGGAGAAAKAAAPEAPRAAAPASGAPTENAAAQTDTRMIIRSGDIAVAVASVEDAARQVQALADRLGGYVANANLFRDSGALRGTVTVRVPAERFGEAVVEVEALGRVETRRLSANDITEEYTDLNARLRNLEATERELLALLTSVRERSGRADDVLAVHRELTNIRAQIEQLKGRINYLDKSSALASLNVNLLPAPAARPLVDNGWAPLETVREASRALVRLLQGLGNAAIWVLIVGLPVMLVVALPLWLLARALRRRGAAHTSAGV